MKLLLKFKLVFIADFVPGWVSTGLVTRQRFERNAQQEVVQQARFMLEKALAVRANSSTRAAPLLETQELVGERDMPSGRALYIARPIKINDGACLRCRSTVDAAARTLVDRYGPANGFGWQLHEVVGAQGVAVPMARAAPAWIVLMGLPTAVFVAIGVALNGMLWWLLVRPVMRLSAIASRVSMGDADAPDFRARGRDEIGVLAHSFARMRLSLGKAMTMLEGTA